jgi:hypothetical protein
MPHTTAKSFNRCQHIFNPSSDLARRCGSPALSGETYCYFHHPQRKPAATRRARHGFTIALPHDHASLQYALHQIMHRIAANQIDPHRASLLLYSLQLAGQSLP